jgi:hypothetical protein
MHKWQLVLFFFRYASLPSPSSDLLHYGSVCMGFVFFSFSGGRWFNQGTAGGGIFVASLLLLLVGKILREGTLEAAVHGETERRLGRRQRGLPLCST